MCRTRVIQGGRRREGGNGGREEEKKEREGGEKETDGQAATERSEREVLVFPFSFLGVLLV